LVVAGSVRESILLKFMLLILLVGEHLVVLLESGGFMKELAFAISLLGTVLVEVELQTTNRLAWDGC
jgi:hypothetical protein